MSRLVTVVLTEPEAIRLRDCAIIDWEAHDDPDHPDHAVIESNKAKMEAACKPGSPDLVALLRTVDAELTTLVARLAGSYAANVRSLITAVRSAVKAVTS